MKKFLTVTLAFLLLAAILPGCTGTAEAKPNFRLLISDEPNDIGDFYSVNVTISQIGVLSADTDNWTMYDFTPVTVDLTKLQGDNATEAWNGSIPSGNYTKMFIYVDNVTGTIKEGIGPGDNVTVKLPSGKLQISKAFTVASDKTVTFIFDITVIKAGESGKYILKPQIGESGADQPYKDLTPTATKNKPTNTKSHGNK
jgi:hypothetical protein